MKLSQLIILLFSVMSLSILPACTSSQTDGDEASAEVTDESLEMAEAVDNNDDLALDLDGGDDAFADFDAQSLDAGLGEGDSSTDMAFSDDTASPEIGADDLSEVPLAESAPSEPPLEDLAPDFSAQPDQFADNTDNSNEDGMALDDTTPEFGAPVESAQIDLGGDTTPEPSFVESEESFASTDVNTGSEESSSSYIPLKKMISTPYKHNGTPVNALYMAREGDTLESISQKIFGGNRVDELCSINAYNCSRGIKVGDKYYYNSPQRPNDMETVKTFYEDAGIPAQTYMTQEGDNIRNLGKTLLGNQRSWMELWATNMNVESKGELAGGIALQYWPSTSAPVMPTMAQTEAPAPAEPAVPDIPETPQMPEANEPPSPPAMDEMAANDIPEMPSMDENVPQDDFAQSDSSQAAAMGTIEPPPPPPPPPPVQNNRPPEPVDVAANDSFEDPNQTMALGVGAILLLASVILFIAIRKRRARRPVDFNTTTQTQIE